MANRIRLPLYISKAQFPTERNVFRKADGSTEVLSVVIRNTYKGVTEYIPEDWHRKLVVALSHDSVNIENERYLTDIVLDSDYEIDWQEFKDYPVAQGNFTVQVTPFNTTNSNCVTCEEVSQAVLVDDTFGSPLVEDDSYSINVLDNDTICCYPSTNSISWWNTDYLNTPSINVDGDLSFTTKASFATATNVKIATYRVTCPDGTYDEADVYADFTGTAVACNCPSNLVFSNIDDSSADATWDAAVPAPAVGYIWNLYDASNPVTPLQTGSTAGLTVNITGLVPDFTYLFQVQSDCDGVISSCTLEDDFTTTGTNDICGSFIISFFTAGPLTYEQYSYMDCNGVVQTDTILNGTEKYNTCMLLVPGTTDPFYWASSHPDIMYTYTEPC